MLLNSLLRRAATRATLCGGIPQLTSTHIRAAAFSSTMSGSSAGLAFKNLKPLDLRNDEARKALLPLGPASLVHGKLDNGLTYYVKKNSKPKQRAALALGVRIGWRSSGTQMAVQEKWGLEQLQDGRAPGVAQRRSQGSVRASAEDVEKERGAVLEEWRERRNAAGRMQDAHWTLMMHGSQHRAPVLHFLQFSDQASARSRPGLGQALEPSAQQSGPSCASGVRLPGGGFWGPVPIGLEKVIRTVPAEVVQAFYRKWYRPHNMAVVAVGDFADTQSAVMVSCKHPQTRMASVDDYRRFLAEEMFHLALNQRFFRLSRLAAPPFYSCQSGGEAMVRTTRACLTQASCRDGGATDALESILTEVRWRARAGSGFWRIFRGEYDAWRSWLWCLAGVGQVARVRLHGFSEREVALVRALYTANMESAYLERDQIQSASLRDEYMQVTAEEMAKSAESYALACSCVVKAVEPKATTTVEDLRRVAARVAALEASGGIAKWQEEDVPEDLVAVPPTVGEVVASTEYPKLGATELVLSNGMRVCYKPTDFLDDQVLISGYAYGGLSEVPEESYHTCAMATTIAGEMGIYGHKPIALAEMLAGKRADVSVKVAAYTRTFGADCSPADLETALQMAAKEDKHRKEVIVTAVNRRHPAYLAFIPEAKPSPPPEVSSSTVAAGTAAAAVAPATAGGAASSADGSGSGGAEVEVVEVYKATHHVAAVLEAVGGADAAAGGRFYTAQEAADVAATYVERAGLAKSTDGAVVVLDAVLCDALFKGAVKKGAAYPTEVHRRDLGPAFVRRMQAHHRVTRGGQVAVKKGALQKVQVLTERRQGNKKVTRVSGVESFLVAPDALAAELQKKFACSTTGGIPKPSEPMREFKRDELSPLPFKFPEGVIREEVKRVMVEAQGSTQITFPVDIGGPKVLLETKVMQVLRFKHGQVYAVSVSPFLGGARPSREGHVRGDVAIGFSCDPESSWKLVDLSLEELQRLQEVGPTEEDVATVLELDQRAYETGLQENGFWLEKVLRAYQSRAYGGDLDASFQIQEDTREAVISAMTAGNMQEALRRVLPVPANSQYTAVSLMPQVPLWRRLLSLPPHRTSGLTVESQVLIASAAAAAGAALAYRFFSTTK
eukprot:jgi/Mesen1/7639/ME000004S07907